MCLSSECIQFLIKGIKIANLAADMAATAETARSKRHYCTLHFFLMYNFKETWIIHINTENFEKEALNLLKTLRTFLRSFACTTIFVD